MRNFDCGSRIMCGVATTGEHFAIDICVEVGEAFRELQLLAINRD
jgi:hypothetical protein